MTYKADMLFLPRGATANGWPYDQTNMLVIPHQITLDFTGADWEHDLDSRGLWTIYFLVDRIRTIMWIAESSKISVPDGYHYWYPTHDWETFEIISSNQTVKQIEIK